MAHTEHTGQLHSQPGVPELGFSPKKPSHHRFLLLFLFVLPLLAAMGAALLYEAHTSKLQARELARLAGELTWQVGAGSSDQVVYPKDGPFDRRLGYLQLPDFLQRLHDRDFVTLDQARFSPALLQYAGYGMFPPYAEKAQAGVDISDCRGLPIYNFRYPQRLYASYDAIAPLIVQSLLYIENRDLLDASRPYLNPAIDWSRFTQAAVAQAGRLVGMGNHAPGGSTLATQIEKYRHSVDGRTNSIRDKLRQMASASVRAYQGGAENLPARRNVVLTYLNSVPLSAQPGYGEVSGLPDGLWIWYGADYQQVNRLLSAPVGQDAELEAQGRALRQVVSLMIAHRRPSYYLARGRKPLGELTDSYLRLLAQAGVIEAPLRDAALAQRLEFRDPQNQPTVQPLEPNKGVSLARTRLAGMLNVPLYDLDRLDLTFSTTLQDELQNKVSSYLKQLADADFAAQIGLFGEHLLSKDKTADVRYSFVLFERTADGNRVRVQTDSTDQPFDINEGSKLELGSTAKLRVLSNYLERIADQYRAYNGKPAAELRKVPVEPLDFISRWSIDYLIANPNADLSAMLAAAMQRKYSASPYESFFTGGGVHTFSNFRREDNGRIPTLLEALRESINLPFVRLLRDLVRHDMYQKDGNKLTVLQDDKDPRRQLYLDRFVDQESRVYLLRFWQKYRGQNADERLDTFLDGLRPWPVRLAAIHRYLQPQADQATFAAFLQDRLKQSHYTGEKLTDKRIADLYTRYGPGAFDLNDQGYVARVHPLELWLLGYLQRQPQASFADAVAASNAERKQVYGWLYKSRYKAARDKRIRIMLEVEAFLDIHQQWKQLGYPFDHLVPSLATALGSSGDRPAALAELMGIILNDGIRLPTLRIDSLHFAAGTPYEVSLAPQANVGTRVMTSEVASTLRDSLSQVVDQGTARRLSGSFRRDDGSALVMGGKTGTGDNRIESFTRSGAVKSSRSLNRTATFVFYLGPRHFGTLTAYVAGSASSNFKFTSALPVQVLKGMAPMLQHYLEPGTECHAPQDTLRVSWL
ncbi:membrane peptidoglycan carboxypeptidase [Pseudomonas citronellolis]|nr:membrane peptidoglycan carboxypeptidase [Pseudomonas citronellolis]MCP1666746.1 membrane peptidoglycan carboxypeptidase [Pseudomonas citronellolis]MCP1697310.1 membrane peptidoglycan carboxypeptidase [Pseudomonas citronellolis]MCP1704285.1 membrane peptidoglycan carboxypeptidase [Pseudomonas citronellolis]MCP1798436.1 membrane peptidoglycan carboxypeptidase [Pseudomonas citronellolis]